MVLDTTLTACYTERVTMKKRRTKDDEGVASEVFDNRRRGEPLSGCDCMHCFGYCMIDRETEHREMLRFMEDIAQRTV